MINDKNFTGVNARNVAGRDVIEQNTIYSPTSPIMDLLTKLSEGEDTETQDYIDKLKDFMRSNGKESTEIIGLEKKLHNGGAEQYYIEYALECKEEFSKILEKNSTSCYTQEVFAHLMSSIRTKFIHHVRPELSNKKCCEVLNLLHKAVIIPTIQLVIPNPLNINEELICGMLFYLTGNCHVEWGNAGLQ
ncbi:ABC-three component system protein [Maridesulfovibrio salexigens]|uniref:ABC-three component systems C-terminal domain-containing protein n=1 Tax=Maridesulfovibrio salexigens (strain ATCC 14822 / DSM 2638 / NCIMB 8403 / VKM B-1763) TaxID=526222 RepID=C6BWE8_MARSD|nr:ABC-three component system protein [Maridesulfovibrio salexigens]ACS78392.1 hypothetical protein Desal_0325 [Maridesulfovibrio salexigens DSM 2638]